MITLNTGIFVSTVLSFKERTIGAVNCSNVICCLGILGDVLVDGKKQRDWKIYPMDFKGDFFNR